LFLIHVTGYFHVTKSELSKSAPIGIASANPNQVSFLIVLLLAAPLWAKNGLCSFTCAERLT
jgi:hypothetical protein